MRLLCMVALFGFIESAVAETAESSRERLVEDSNERYKVTAWVEKESMTSGETQVAYAEVAHLSVDNRETGTHWESRLEFDAEIHALVMTAVDEFVTVSTLINGYGGRVRHLKISGDLSPEELEVLHAYWPYMAPNRRWVFYSYWYPRTGTPDESKYTSTWIVDITRPEMEPKLVYPPDSRSGRAADGRIHSALTNGIAPLWSPDSRRLYYFDMLSTNYAWDGAVVSLIEVQFGEDMTIDEISAHPIAVEDFAKPGADLGKLAFYPVELHWVADGVIGGKLSQKPGWKSQDFYMTRDGKFVSPDDMKK